MTQGKFASLDNSILARKGNAAPAGSAWPTPAIPPVADAAENVAPGLDEGVQEAAQHAGETENNRLSPRSQPPVFGSQSSRSNALRQKLSIRLVPEQLRRLKAASMQLGFSQQQIVTAALDSYFDNLSEQKFPGCGCLKRDIDEF